MDMGHTLCEVSQGLQNKGCFVRTWGFQKSATQPDICWLLRTLGIEKSLKSFIWAGVGWNKAETSNIPPATVMPPKAGDLSGVQRITKQCSQSKIYLLFSNQPQDSNVNTQPTKPGAHLGFRTAWVQQRQSLTSPYLLWKELHQSHINICFVRFFGGERGLGQWWF